MTVVRGNTSFRSKIIMWQTRSMSKPQPPNPRWRRALQKVRWFARPSRPYENPTSNGLRRANPRVSRKQWDHIPSDKLPAVPEVFQANCGDSRIAGSSKWKHSWCRRMQRKYAPNDRLSPIAEEIEVGFKEALEAETRNTEHWKVRIHRAKPRQHWEVRDKPGQGKRTSIITTPSEILESLVAIWINNGGSLLVMVLLGTVVSNFIW